MNSFNDQIDISSPKGRRFLQEVIKHPKIARIEQIDPRILNPATSKSHNEIWKEMEEKLNKFYNSDLKLDY